MGAGKKGREKKNPEDLVPNSSQPNRRKGPSCEKAIHSKEKECGQKKLGKTERQQVPRRVTMVLLRACPGGGKKGARCFGRGKKRKVGPLQMGNQRAVRESSLKKKKASQKKTLSGETWRTCRSLGGKTPPCRGNFLEKDEKEIVAILGERPIR